MSLTPSTMLPLGTPAPDFRLVDAVSGRVIALEDFTQAPALLVIFMCNHCPFVIHVHEELTRLTSECAEQGVAVVAINSNDTGKYPQDGPAKMKELVEQKGWRFPFLLDETQEIAKAYRAACTPDFFLFDGEGRLAYRGRLDASRPESGIPLTGEDLRSALQAVLSGATPEVDQKPSMGCNIKWRPGNEPEYFG